MHGQQNIKNILLSYCPVNLRLWQVVTFYLGKYNNILTVGFITYYHMNIQLTVYM